MKLFDCQLMSCVCCAVKVLDDRDQLVVAQFPLVGTDLVVVSPYRTSVWCI